MTKATDIPARSTPAPTRVTRRGLLLGGLGAAGVGALAGCDASSPTQDKTVGVPPSSPLTSVPRQRTFATTLTAQPATVDVGGHLMHTWAYGDTLPGRTLRATAGDLLHIAVQNQLPADTTVHWHGVRVRNVADGVPGVTQQPIRPGSTYLYEFTAPDPGTFFFHPHVGVQLDRGLYAPLILDDPHESGGYDHDWVIVLDDWIDGTGTTPDAVLKKLLAGGSMTSHSASSARRSTTSTASSGGMGDMSMGPPPWGDAGDVRYPLYLINGKSPTDPVTFTGRPGQRARIRFINAGSDTIFSVGLDGHRMKVTHTDGHPVRPRDVGALYIGMGERYDVLVTLGDGAFGLFAKPFGKTGHALAVVRTGAGTAPAAGTPPPAQLDRQVLVGSTLQPAAGTRLPARAPDRTVDLILSGQMSPYRWALNGAPYGKNTPISCRPGERLRLNIRNDTMMSHPIHLHGPTFALAETGLRKDTLLLAPMERRAIDLDPAPGNWMIHCHNVYHAEAGMMIVLSCAQ